MERIGVVLMGGTKLVDFDRPLSCIEKDGSRRLRFGAAAAPAASAAAEALVSAARRATSMDVVCLALAASMVERAGRPGVAASSLLALP